MYKYMILKAGDTLHKHDEYCVSGGTWRVIPPFMIGNVIPDCPSTKWRRSQKDETPIPVQKAWYSFLFEKK